MASIFERGPTLYSPAWRFSLGFALGFYPLNLPLWLRVGLGLGGSVFAFLVASRRFARGEPGGRDRARTRGVLLAILCSGLVAGSLVASAGLGLEAAPWPQAGVRLAPSEGQVAGNAGTGPLKLAGLGVTGLSGRLVADSRPARGGQRIMDLEVQSVFVAGPGMAGSYSTRARARAIVREGPSLAAGARIELRGRPSSDGSPLLFAGRRDLLVREEGGSTDRFRNRLHDAFLGAILAAVGRPSPQSNQAGRAGTGVMDAASEDAALEDAAGLLLALLAGWQDELSQEDAAAFKAAGCTHILALSGQHLALIAAGLVFVLRPLVGPLRALVPTFGLVWLYVIVVGPGPSLLRALLSFGIVAVASLSDRPQDGRTILGLCFVIHFLLFPDQLREAGFVLSYLAVAGLVVLGPRIEYLIAPFFPPPLSGALAASLAAQIATSPWIALSFGIVQPVGILATLATATLVEAVMIGGLLAALVVAILPQAAVATAPVELFLLRLLEETMRMFAAIPSIRLGDPLVAATAALSIVLLAAFLYALPHVRFPGSPRQPSGAVDLPPRL